MAENTNTEHEAAFSKELADTAMRFVDRAGDVHPGIDDAETICAEFHAAMSAVIDKYRPMPTSASLSLPTAGQEPVYAFRRKGLRNFCTCDADRYAELSAKPNLFEVRVFYAAPRPAVAAGWSEGIQAAAKLLEKKADDFAQQHGYDDMGSLSFGRGAHADAKLDYHSELLELAEEIRALPPAPSTEGA